MPDYESGETPDGLSADDVRRLYHELKGVASGRNGEYAVKRDRYIGKHWGDSENPTPTGNRYTLTLNYVRPTVDKTVQLLLAEMPGVQVLPPGTDQTARDSAEGMEALIYATWEQNEAPMVFRRVAHNRSLLGRGIVYVWWDNERKVARFRSIAPDNFYPVYDGEEIVECVIVSRRLTRALQRNYPQYASKITSDDKGDDVFDEGRWTRMVNGQIDSLSASGGVSTRTVANSLAGQTTVYDYYDKYGNWTRVMGEAVHRQKLGYDFGRVPVVEFLNSMPGDEREPLSDVQDIIDLNLYADQLMSQQADIIKKYSNPTILDKQSGQPAQQIRQTVQGEGGVLPIKREGDIMYLNWQGTPPDISAQWNRVLSAIYDLSGKPPSAYGQILSNQSGVTTNMSMSPTVVSNQDNQTLFGFGLMILNEMILRLNEKFMGTNQIEVRSTAPTRPGRVSWKYYDIRITGDQIGGWYKNRIKWASALRTDDPIFVQNELNKAKADPNNPPMQSSYSTMENLGIEDVEEEKRRIASELEDPRLHPERLRASIDAAMAFQQSQIPSPMAGLDPAMQVGLPGGGVGGEMDAALEAGGNPAGPKSAAGGGRTGEV